MFNLISILKSKIGKTGKHIRHPYLSYRGGGILYHEDPHMPALFPEGQVGLQQKRN